MPLDPPVTSAVRPSRSMVILGILEVNKEPGETPYAKSTPLALITDLYQRALSFNILSWV
jgi:hypothetical protein